MSEDVMAGIQYCIDIVDAVIASGDCSDDQERLLEAIIGIFQEYGE